MWVGKYTIPILNMNLIVKAPWTLNGLIIPGHVADKWSLIYHKIGFTSWVLPYCDVLSKVCAISMMIL